MAQTKGSVSKDSRTKINTMSLGVEDTIKYGFESSDKVMTNHRRSVLFLRLQETAFGKLTFLSLNLSRTVKILILESLDFLCTKDSLKVL